MKPFNTPRASMLKTAGYFFAIFLLSISGIFPVKADTAAPGSLGRLFFTPQQRTQLNYSHSTNAAADDNSSAVFTVNGIVQKHGGARTVWVNGVSQAADNSGERTLTAQTVNIPGKPRPVKLKVGEKVLLDQPAPTGQSKSGE
jgi:hypothetical protein